MRHDAYDKSGFLLWLMLLEISVYHVYFSSFSSIYNFIVSWGYDHTTKQYKQRLIGTYVPYLLISINTRTLSTDKYI